MHFVTPILMDLFFRLLSSYLEPIATLTLEHLMSWLNSMLRAAPPLIW